MIPEPLALVSILIPHINYGIIYGDGEGGSPQELPTLSEVSLMAHFLFVTRISEFYELLTTDNYEAEAIPMVQEQGTPGTAPRQFSLKTRIPRTRAFEVAVTICWYFKSSV
jgi:hypothetical protein